MRGARSVCPAGCKEISPAFLDDPAGQLLRTPKHLEAMGAPTCKHPSVDFIELDDLFLLQFRLAGSDLLRVRPEVENQVRCREPTVDPPTHAPTRAHVPAAEGDLQVVQVAVGQDEVCVGAYHSPAITNDLLEEYRAVE